MPDLKVPMTVLAAGHAMPEVAAASGEVSLDLHIVIDHMADCPDRPAGGICSRS